MSAPHIIINDTYIYHLHALVPFCSHNMPRDEVREIMNGGNIIIPILLLEKLEKR